MSDAFERAERLFDAQDWDAALGLLRAVLDEDPADAEARAMLAACHAHLGDDLQALVEAQAAIGTDPEYAYAHHVLAWIHRFAGRYQEAVEPATEAVRLAPDLVENHAGLADALFHTRQFSEASDSVAAGLAIDPQDADLLSIQSHLKRRHFDLSEAKRCARAAIESDPDNPRGYEALGWALLLPCRYWQATTAFERALELFPNYGSARAGLVYALRGRYTLCVPPASWRLGALNGGVILYATIAICWVASFFVDAWPHAKRAAVFAVYIPALMFVASTVWMLLADVLLRLTSARFRSAWRSGDARIAWSEYIGNLFEHTLWMALPIWIMIGFVPALLTLCFAAPLLALLRASIRRMARPPAVATLVFLFVPAMVSETLILLGWFVGVLLPAFVQMGRTNPRPLVTFWSIFHMLSGPLIQIAALLILFLISKLWFRITGNSRPPN